MNENGLFEQLPVGVAVLDRVGRFQRSNPAFRKAVGYGSEGLSAIRLSELVLPEARNDVAEMLRQLADNRREEVCRTIQCIDGRGNPRWITMSIRLAEIDDVSDAHMLVTAVDVTAQRQTEANLARDKEEFERIFHAVPDPIAVLDVDHRIVRVNRAMAQRLGCTREEIIGHTCFEVVHGFDRPMKECPHACLLGDGVECHREIHEDRLGGDFLVSVSPIRDANGRLAGGIHVARDITKRKQAELALHKANSTLEKRVTDRTRELDALNQTLRQEIVERHRLEAEVLHAGTREQRRMGEELHDQLGQELTGLRYLASSLARRLRTLDLSEANTATELASGIGQALQRTRAIVRGLLPVEIDARNLVPALESLAADIEERFALTCRFLMRGIVPIKDDHTAIQLYRIVQGASNNAIKHGHAENINIEIFTQDDQIVLRV